MSFVGSESRTGNVDTSLVRAIHPPFGGLPRTGLRTVVVVILSDATTITAIHEVGTTIDGGFTARGTYTAQGKTFWLFDKICGTTEASGYDVKFTPTVSLPQRNTAHCWLADFSTTGDAIAASGFADSDNGTTLTLPSIRATDGDDIWSVVWCDPLTTAGILLAQSPLTNSGSGSAGLNYAIAAGREVWQSSSPTGTRTFAVASGTYEDGVGVIMLVGGYPFTGGGWGVGQIRMGN